MVTRGWEVGKMGGCLLNGKNFQLYDKFGDLMDSMVNIIIILNCILEIC